MLYEFTLESSMNICDDIYISTDIEKIIDSEKRAKVIIRPDNLSRDDASMEEVIRHAISNIPDKEYLLVLLQPTSPLRTERNIKDALKMYLELEDFEETLLFTGCVVKSSVLKSWIFNDSNYKPINSIKYSFANDQQLPVVFNPNGAIYIFSPKVFVQNGFEFKKFKIFEMDHKDSIDINNIEDINMLVKEIKKA